MFGSLEWQTFICLYSGGQEVQGLQHHLVRFCFVVLKWHFLVSTQDRWDGGSHWDFFCKNTSPLIRVIHSVPIHLSCCDLTLNAVILGIKI